MTRQEQIEQMARIMCGENQDSDSSLGCGSCDVYYDTTNCCYKKNAGMLIQNGYGKITDYKNRLEVACNLLIKTRTKLTKAEHDRDRYKAEIERLKAEDERFTNTMKNVLEIEKKQAKIDALDELKAKMQKARLNDDTAEIIIDMIEELMK